MTPDEYAAAVHESLAPETRKEFDDRVEIQADAVAADLAAGLLDNADFAVGLELEAYVTDPTGTLSEVPTELFGADGTNPELGVHNLELNTGPNVLNGRGMRHQARRLRKLVTTARERLPEDCRLALDAMWTVPPTEGTRAYLSSGIEHDGVFLSRNMHADARYYALDNEVRNRADGEIDLSVPGVELAVPSILIESLTASIQPHLQVPDPSTFPRYHDLAIRTLGPVLSLAANSPFLPADLYRPVEDPSAVERLLSAAPHEHRVPVFEDAINAGLVGDKRKVRVPNDLNRLEHLPARVVADVTYAPHLYDDLEAASAAADEQSVPFADRIPEYRHKRGTYWRWVRGVVGGDVPTSADGEPTAPGNDTASLRLEYRPLPTQPTVRDTVAFQGLVVGLLRGLVIENHPLGELPWTDASDAFYAAVDAGPEATLYWVDDNGAHTENRERIRQEVLDYARRGLAASGADGTTVDWLLAPIKARVRSGMTPSSWQRDRVLSSVRDGATLPEAIRETKRAYLERAASTESFADWL